MHSPALGMHEPVRSGLSRLSCIARSASPTIYRWIPNLLKLACKWSCVVAHLWKGWLVPSRLNRIGCLVPRARTPRTSSQRTTNGNATWISPQINIPCVYCLFDVSLKISCSQFSRSYHKRWQMSDKTLLESSTVFAFVKDVVLLQRQGLRDWSWSPWVTALCFVRHTVVCWSGHPNLKWKKRRIPLLKGPEGLVILIVFYRFIVVTYITAVIMYCRLSLLTFLTLFRETWLKLSLSSVNNIPDSTDCMHDAVFISGWLCEWLAKELEDMELRLRHGGLGGVQACDRWDTRLSAAKTVKDFVSCRVSVIWDSVTIESCLWNSLPYNVPVYFGSRVLLHSRLSTATAE